MGVQQNNVDSLITIVLTFKECCIEDDVFAGCAAHGECVPYHTPLGLAPHRHDLTQVVDQTHNLEPFLVWVRLPDTYKLKYFC